MELTWAQSVYYLYVDEVLAVLDGVDISLEDWVLTGPSWPTICRAQNLKGKKNTFMYACIYAIMSIDLNSVS